jgi:hypothetical protein
MLSAQEMCNCSGRNAATVPVLPSAGKTPDGSNYDWAIVSGGPPRTNTGAGCAAGPLNPTIFDVNGAGETDSLGDPGVLDTLLLCAISCYSQLMAHANTENGGLQISFLGACANLNCEG